MHVLEIFCIQPSIHFPKSKYEEDHFVTKKFLPSRVDVRIAKLLAN